MKFRPHGRLLILILVLVASQLQHGPVRGQSSAPTSATAAEDAAKRLEWLKSRVPNGAQPATPTPPKKRFAVTRSSDLRPIELPRESTPAPGQPTVAHTPAEAPTTPALPPRVIVGEPPMKKSSASTKPVETTTIASKSKKSPSDKSLIASATPAPPTRTVEKSTPAPKSRTASTSAHDLLSVPAQTAKLSMPAHSSTTSLVLPQPTPDPYRLSPVPRSVGGRFPWKTNIVTTVFWIGERPTANNPTPNHASSWDPNWANAYGGYDNPDPDHRRNFIPVAFTPRQNPFYVALPYNDVTRGTTKPESRLVIPWFKSAFQREGLSVCRDRWVAVRSRDGKVGYAQWSDCGPFRTDHWQYVFGNERPRPNLNNGAGLDVSPALRDYLSLRGTDVTDWKFVDARDVPSGPWARYGENNTVARRDSRGK